MTADTAPEGISPPAGSAPQQVRITEPVPVYAPPGQPLEVTQARSLIGRWIRRFANEREAGRRFRVAGTGDPAVAGVRYVLDERHGLDLALLVFKREHETDTGDRLIVPLGAIRYIHAHAVGPNDHEGDVVIWV